MGKVFFNISIPFIPLTKKLVPFASRATQDLHFSPI